MDLVKHAVTGHGHTLRGCFASILGLADYLLRAPETILRRHGALLYALAFDNFPDTYHQQEVLGALIAHIGSRSRHEIDGTLDVFEILSENGTRQLAAHAGFIDVHMPITAARNTHSNTHASVEMLLCCAPKGMLEYLDGLSERHARRLLQVFASVAAAASKNYGSRLSDDLHILIRKYLGASSEKHKVHPHILHVVGKPSTK